AAEASLPPGVFQFTGSVAHNALADYLNVLDVLVLPSRTRRHWKEQFGRVLVEALACEVPLVGSDSGHIPELVKTTGGGLVFHEGRADDLADKLGYLMDHPAEAREMASRGRQVVLRDYSYPRVAQTLYEALKGVV
ncbi:MAG: glycosyltransferase family 4 protein, partial [Armatimonadia bacterium]